MKRYNHAAVAISMYEDLWLHGWIETCTQSKIYLNNSLLKKSSDGRYISNFSPAIKRIAVESRMLKSNGYRLPEYSVFLLEQEKRMKDVSTLLDHIVNKYYHILSLPAGSLELVFSTTFAPIEKNLVKCIEEFTWMSLGVNEHLRLLEQSLNELRHVFYGQMKFYKFK